MQQKIVVGLQTFFFSRKWSWLFPAMEKQKLYYYIILWAIAHVLCHPQPLSMGPKLLGALCEPLPMMILKSNHGSRSEICSFSRILYYQLIEFVQRQWHCKEMGPRFLKELTGVVTTGDEWYIISHNISDGSVVTLSAFFSPTCWVLIPNSRWFQPYANMTTAAAFSQTLIDLISDIGRVGAIHRQFPVRFPPTCALPQLPCRHGLSHNPSRNK